jgi:hypothetical protein
MMSDSDNWGGSRLIYTTPLSVLETKDFYLQQMPVEGWVIEKEIAPQENPEPYQRALGGARKAGLAQLLQIDLGEFVQQSYLLEFKGSQGRAQITIFPNLLDKGRTSMVSITYERPR